MTAVVVIVLFLAFGFWLIRKHTRENGPGSFVSVLQRQCASCGFPDEPLSKGRVWAYMPVLILLDLTILPALVFRWMNYKVMQLLTWLEVPIGVFYCDTCSKWHDEKYGVIDADFEEGEFPGFARNITEHDLPIMCSAHYDSRTVPDLVAYLDEKQFDLTGWWDE